MAKKNPLLDILQGKTEPKQTQPKQTASSNSGGGGRSISNQKDAFKDALDEQPSTFQSWNPEQTQQPEKKQKKKFLGLTIPDGSENVWDYDATNNLLNTAAPAKPKEEKKTPTNNGYVSLADLNRQQREPKIDTYKDPNAGKSMAGSSYSQALAGSKQEPDNNIFRQDIGDKQKPKREKSGTSHNKQPVSETDAPKPWEMEVDSPDYRPEQKKGFLEWIKNTGKAAAEGTAASISGAERALYEAGQGGRTAQYEEERAQLERDLDRALRSYQYDKEDGMSESDLQADLNVIEDIQRRLDAYNKVLNENVQEEATKATSELSNQLQEESAKATEAAKMIAGDNPLGNLATDVTVNALQMAGDAAMNLIAPGLSLPTMGLRTFGSSAQEAEAEGATLAQQLGYGAVKGGIEVASELMFDGLAGIYGKGGADEIVEEVIRKMTKPGNDAGRTALRILFGGLGEAVEEGVSGVADPFAKMIYQGVSSLPENINKEMAAETLYSMLVGFAMGGGMTSVDIGGNKSSNAALAATDAVQAQLEAEGFNTEDAQRAAPLLSKADSGEQLSPKEKNILLEIMSRQDIDVGSNTSPVNANPVANTQAVGAAPTVSNGGNSLLEAVQQAATNDVNARTSAVPSAPNATEEATPINPLATAETDRSSPAETTNPAAEVGTKATENTAPEMPAPQPVGAEPTVDTTAKQADVGEQKANDLGSSAERIAEIQQEIADLEQQPPSPERDAEIRQLVEEQAELEQETTEQPENILTQQMEETSEPVQETVEEEQPENVATQQEEESSSGTEQATEETATEEQEESPAPEEPVQEEQTRTTQGEQAAEETATTETAEAETNAEPWIPPVRNPGSSTPKVSKTSINSMRNTAEQNGGTQEALYYTPKSEKESLTNAMNRVDADMVGEMQSLMNKGMWTGEDSDAAYTIYGRLMFDAVRNRDRTAVDEWAKVVQQHKTETARALQSTAKWARTGAAAAMAASSDIDANDSLTPEQKTELKNQVYKAAQTFDNIEQNDVDGVRSLILKLNEIRNTGTFGAKNFEKILNKINDFDYLKEFALRQIMAVPTDSTNQADIGQQLKTWQVNSQLIRLGTFFRNFFGNASFDIVDTFSQDAFGYAIDSAISKIAKTGRKEVGFDKGWLSKNARQAAVDAMNRSILEVAADVDMSGEASKYGNTSNRTNKMSGGKFEQFLSRWEQLLGYSLTTSDRFFRGQIESSYAEGLNGLSETERNALAEAVADYRLFQNQGVAAGISKGLHDILNLAGVGGEVTSPRNGRQGGFGLGDALNPYPGVPANLAVKALEYSPLNIVKGFREVVKLARDVKMGEDVTGQQMQAAMDIARGITGVPIIMLFTALAKTKLFRNSDDEEDYDVSSENSAQGLSGVQWNLDATLRALNGEKAEWKDGDQLMKVSWLEPLNAFMSIASMIADEDSDATIGSYIKDSLFGALTAAMDLPVMENAQKVFNSLRYADKGNFLETLGDAGAQLLGDFAGGMIPAPISQMARVTDNFVRDTKGDNKAQTAFNALLNNIPGLRNQLPVKTDNFGNERLNEPNELLRTMNSFALPGAVNTFQETDVQKEVARLYELSDDLALYPDRAGPKSLEIGSEKFDLTADEQRAYHEIAGSKSEEYVKGLIDSDYYKGLTDEQKAAAIKETYSIAKDLAKADYAKTHGISYDSNIQKLLSGVDKPGTPDDRTPLKENNIPAYVAFKTGFDDAVKNGDYKTIDKYVSSYSDLGKNLRTVISERDDDLRAVKKFSDIGVGSKSYYSYKDSLAETQAALDKSGSASGNAKLMALASAKMSESDREKIILGLKSSDGSYDLGTNAVVAYKALSKYGMTTADVSKFFDTALNCKYKDGEKYDTRGKLQPDTVAYALSRMKGLTDEQREKIFKKFKSELSVPTYNDWKDYTYAKEMNYIKKWSKYSYSGGKIKTSGSTDNDLLGILSGKSSGNSSNNRNNELLKILGG